MRKTALCMLLVLPVCTSIVRAEVMATVGVASNYVWRGETRTEDGPAVFATLGYQHESGLYAGLHTFNIEAKRKPETDNEANVGGDGSREYELDGWIGYRFDIGTVRMDIGAITYQFPRGERIDLNDGTLVQGTRNDSDFHELYAKLSYGRVTIGYYGTDDYFGSGLTSHYPFIDYRHPLGSELFLGLHYGLKESDAVPDHDGTVFDFGISLEKGPLLLSVTNLDDNEDGLQSDNPRVTVAWRHGMTL